MSKKRTRARCSLPSLSLACAVATISRPFHDAELGVNLAASTSSVVRLQRPADWSSTLRAWAIERRLPRLSRMRSSSSIPQPSKARQAFQLPLNRGAP